jgi:Electron transfer DM13
MREKTTMLPKVRIACVTAVFALLCGFRVSGDTLTPTGAKIIATGTFHGKLHNTSGRATIYEESNGRQILRLTNFKTSNGPDLHVVLIALKDASDDANFLKERYGTGGIGQVKGKRRRPKL